MPCPNHPQIHEPLVACGRCAVPHCLDCVVPVAGIPHCAACKAEALADLAAGVTLVGALDLASIGSRFAALFLDGLVIGLPAVALSFAVAIPLGFFSLEQTAASGAVGLVFQLLYTFLYLGGWMLYEGLMLARGGQTLGKKALRLKVVSADGGDLSRGQAFGRTAGRQLLGLIPCFSLVDYALAFGQERTCIHDMLAKTRVVNFHG